MINFFLTDIPFAINICLIALFVLALVLALIREIFKRNEIKGMSGNNSLLQRLTLIFFIANFVLLWSIFLFGFPFANINNYVLFSFVLSFLLFFLFNIRNFIRKKSGKGERKGEENSSTNQS